MTLRMMLPLTALLAGCAQTVRFPPDLWNWDEDLPPEDGQWIDSIESWCDVDNTWTWRVFLMGVAGGSTLHVFESSQSETHQMRLVETDEQEGWDVYELGPLTSGVEPGEQVPGASSLFDCNAQSGIIGGAVVVEDRLDNVVDCAWWGDQPDRTPDLVQTPEIDAIGGCRWVDR